jgi:hypothetical protein
VFCGTAGRVESRETHGGGRLDEREAARWAGRYCLSGRARSRPGPTCCSFIRKKKEEEEEEEVLSFASTRDDANVGEAFVDGRERSRSFRGKRWLALASSHPSTFAQTANRFHSYSYPFISRRKRPAAQALDLPPWPSADRNRKGDETPQHATTTLAAAELVGEESQRREAKASPISSRHATPRHQTHL